MSRYGLTILFLLAGISSAEGVVHERLEHVQFTREFSAVTGRELNINWRETQRVEHFLRRVFPSREMYRFERRNEGTQTAFSAPLVRQVEYAFIEQEGYRFILVHFHAARLGEAGTSVIAVYRLEPDGPNQVWKSPAWESTYHGFHFQTAKIGWRNIVLFKEGGAEDHFGLAGIFSFHNAKNGLYLRVLTPQMPRLSAITRFPIRPMLARNISMDAGAMREIVLAASDEAFLHSREVVTVHRWVFNDRRGVFEVSVQSNEAEK